MKLLWFFLCWTSVLTIRLVLHFIRCMTRQRLSLRSHTHTHTHTQLCAGIYQSNELASEPNQIVWQFAAFDPKLNSFHFIPFHYVVSSVIPIVRITENTKCAVLLSKWFLFTTRFFSVSFWDQRGMKHISVPMKCPIEEFEAPTKHHNFIFLSVVFCIEFDEPELNAMTSLLNNATDTFQKFFFQRHSIFHPFDRK